MVNLSTFIRFHARQTPDRLAVVYDDQRITYGEVAERSGRLAAFLAGMGIEPGDVVAAFMKNSAAFLELALAVSHLGGVFLPINFRLAADEVRYIVENAGARLVFVDLELAGQTAGLANVVELDAAAQHDTRRLVKAGLEIPPEARRTPDDLFRLMYTSGTTDRPKGVMHSYGNFYWKCMDHVVALGLSAADRLLVVGPLYHVGAFDLPGLALLWVGGMLCLQRDFDAVAALEAIGRERLTGAWLAPVMLTHMLAAARERQFELGTLRWVIGGGEKTPEARIREFGSAFPNGRYIDAYGLTETCSGDTLMEAGMEIAKIGSTGRATPHVEIEIRDDAGAPLGPGTEGEICLRGPKVFKGYWRDPGKTSASFFGDWFRTGDIGYLDEDGFLFLTDRKKDLIISGGENIASSEVERVVYQLPAVNEVAVIGVPDEKWGERPVAIVVLREGASLDLAVLEAHCRQHLARFKVPRELHIRESLPRNPSGKVLKRVLRQEFAR
jgi:acyl-CoA synthetase (AMP-forming)/AMP-acid ligase II